jgi:hypothetical protein
MHTREQCLALIAEVRATSDPESAYLLRSRLGRAALSAARLALGTAGATYPAVPQQITTYTSSDDPSNRVLRAADRLVEITRILCQPSEALDSRWKAGWNRAVAELGNLEAAVRDLSI